MRRFFLEKQYREGDSVNIAGSDAKHILTVLRLKQGDILGFFDPDGFEYTGRITSSDKGGLEVKIDSKKVTEKESPVNIIFAQAFLKDKKIDTVLRQLTELGINEFLTFFSKRSVPSPDEKRIAKKAERWNKITLEAVKQCERGKVPVIHKTLSFDQMIDYSRAYDLKLIFYERDHGSALTDFESPESVFMAIGPEGGFTDDEVKKAEEAGFIKVSLGPRILKAETAAVAAATVIQHVFGDLS